MNIEQAKEIAKFNAISELRSWIQTEEGVFNFVDSLPYPRATLAYLLLVVVSGNDVQRIFHDMIEDFIKEKAEHKALEVNIDQLLED